MIGKETGSSRSLAKELNYIGDSATKAHPNENGVTVRNLALAGVGVRTDTISHTIADFRSLARKKPHTKVKTVNFVLSSKRGDVDPNDSEQVSKFKRYAVHVGQQFAPHHLIYVAIQADNKNEIPHAHLIISNISTFPPHHAVDHDKISDKRFQQVAEAVRKTPDFSDFSKVLINGKDYRTDATKSRRHDVKQALATAMNKVRDGTITSKWAFVHECEELGLEAKFTAPKRHRAYKMIKDSHGHWHYDYRVDKHGKRHRKPLYRRTKDGKHYQYRTNKNGNKARIPRYYHSPAGLVVRKRKASTHGNRNGNRYYNASRLGVRGVKASRIISQIQRNGVNNYAFNLANNIDASPLSSTIGDTDANDLAENRVAVESTKREDDADFSQIHNPKLDAKPKAKAQKSSDDEFVKKLPDLKPKLNQLSLPQAQTLHDDVDLLPKLATPKEAKPAVQAITDNHKRHHVSMNLNDSKAKPIWEITNQLIGIAKSDAHKLKLIARHYDKVITGVIDDMKRKLAQHRKKSQLKKETGSIDPNLLKSMTAKLSQDANSSRRAKAKIGSSKPSKANSERLPKSKVFERAKAHQQADKASRERHRRQYGIER